MSTLGNSPGERLLPSSAETEVSKQNRAEEPQAEAVIEVRM